MIKNTTKQDHANNVMFNPRKHFTKGEKKQNETKSMNSDEMAEQVGKCG